MNCTSAIFCISRAFRHCKFTASVTGCGHTTDSHWHCSLQSQMSRQFGIDIHPAARFGHGIMLDHATGLVVGETAVVGNRVSILQSVTLGGTGKEDGDRHPKIGDGVLI